MHVGLRMHVEMRVCMHTHINGPCWGIGSYAYFGVLKRIIGLFSPKSEDYWIIM